VYFGTLVRFVNSLHLTALRTLIGLGALRWFLPTLLGLLLFTAPLEASPSARQAGAPAEIPLTLWSPQAGDRFLVDTKNNVGYLFHDSGEYTSFQLITGQQRVVHYIGLTYNAATPVGEWLAKSKHIQPDRITYGKHGKFLRLYEDGEEYTHYGIHTHAYVEEMLDSDNHFRSMGCVIVSDDLYHLIERTWELNGESLPVVTRYGVEIGGLGNV
jgi:hypothetical protein